MRGLKGKILEIIGEYKDMKRKMEDNEKESEKKQVLVREIEKKR